MFVCVVHVSVYVCCCVAMIKEATDKSWCPASCRLVWKDTLWVLSVVFYLKKWFKWTLYMWPLCFI